MPKKTHASLPVHLGFVALIMLALGVVLGLAPLAHGHEVTSDPSAPVSDSPDDATGEPEADEQPDQTPQEGEPEDAPIPPEDQDGKNPDGEASPDDTRGSPAGMVTKVTATSMTENIVGDVFANSVNYMSRQAEQGNEDAELPSLADYPLDPHSRDYYGDSLRVRPLRTEGDDEAYLVYRDSFLIIPEDEAHDYEVGMSEDGRLASVFPAIPASRLSGKSGIVFLKENVGEDIILVFDGDPLVADDGSLTVATKEKSSIYLSELFSDGKFKFSSKSSAKGPSRLMSGNRGLFDQDISGTNWSGHLTNFRPGTPDADLEMDPWKLRFGLRLHVAAQVDFDIQSTGATGKLETKKIASISIPVEAIEIELAYQFQAQFDETPVSIAGSLTSEMDYYITTWGADIDNFRTPVRFTRLDIPERYANKDVHFYIGTMFSIDAGLFGIDIDLWVTSIEIGPVLQLNQKSRGGVHVTARWDKNMFNSANPNRNKDILHACCDEGSPGCLTVESREIYQHYIEFVVDLYFKSWPNKLTNSDEVSVRTTTMYDSKTHHTGLKEGICPHKLFNVPVAVWRVGPLSHPSQPAGAGLRVSLNDVSAISDPIAKALAQGITDESGRTSIFLPFEADKRNIITASGTIDYGDEQIPVIGTSAQPTPMRKGRNDVTNIILESAVDTELRITKHWEVDIDGNEMPQKVQMLVLRKEIDDTPTSDGEPDASDSNLVPIDIVSLSPNLDNLTTWETVLGQPKYSLSDAGGEEPYAYEYTVRELRKGYSSNGLIGPDVNFDYFPDDYLTNPLLDEDTLAKRRKAVWRHAVDTPEESTGSSPSIAYVIPQYATQGKIVPEHEATYWVSYDESLDEDGYHFAITNTAMQQVFVSKNWVVKNDTPIPDYVYLTVMWRPEEGWAQIASTRNVPNTWVPIINPITGPTTTLAELMEDRVMNTIDLHGIDNVPIAIAKVFPEGNGVWRVGYDVPKYHNGVPMQLMGAELDSTCVSNLLRYGFDLAKQVNVKTPEGFCTSFPGFAQGRSDLFQLAYVMNTDTDPMHTIGGVKVWENGDIYGMPDWLRIEVWDDDSEEAPVKVGETTLYAADNPMSNIWPWTLYDPAINPDRTYRFVEVYPDGYAEASHWLPEVIDYDIHNHYVVPEGSKIRIKVQFDKECPPTNPHGVEIHLYDADGQPLKYPSGLPVPTVFATRDSQDDAYNYSVEVPGWFANDMDFAHFTIAENNLETFDPGYEWAREYGYQDFYSAPMQSFELGYKGAPDTPVWTYTVTNLAQGDVHLPVYKTWDDDDSPNRPDAIKVTLYQDGTKVNTKYITGDWPGEWYTPMQKTQDDEHLHLKRFDPADGHFYTYTLTEEHVDGYWSQITTSITQAYITRFDINNKLIGDRGVTLRGTVNWEGDEGKEHLRPKTVHIIAVCNGDTVASVDVPVTDNAWEIKDMPRYDADGEILEYSILESHVDGYTIIYDDPIYDEEEHVWTLDLTNKLTGYFPLTVKKVIENTRDGDSIEHEFEFAIDPVDNIAEVDWGFPTPVGWPENLKIQGQGEGKFEFLIDQEGLYLYTIREVKGTAPLITYDEDIKSVLVAATKDEDGMMQYQCWIGPEGEVSFNLSTFTPNNGSGGENQDPAPTPSGSGGENQDPAPTPSGSGGENQDPAPTPSGDGDGNQDPAPTPSGDGDGNQEPAPTPSGDGDENQDPAPTPSSDNWTDTDTVKKTDKVTFTNSYGRSYSVEKKWDFKEQDETKPSSLKMQLQRRDGDDDNPSWVAVETIELTEATEWKGTFAPVQPTDEDIAAAKAENDDGSVPSTPPAGTAASPGNQPDLPSQWEVDPEGAIASVMDKHYRIRELDENDKPALAEDDEDNEEHEKPGIVVTVTKDGKEEKRGFLVAYETEEGKTTVTNTLGKLFQVEKEWVIDAEKKDKPTSIKVQLQKKEKKEQEGNNDNNNNNNNNDNDKEKWDKVHELELSDENEWKGYFKPVAFEEKDEDYRIRELDKDGKPVLLKEDKDLEGSEDEKKHLPTVVYENAEGNSTKYYVSYERDDDKHMTTITNKAVMDVSIYKRWLMFGDADKPDSVYLMLLGRAKTQEGGEAAAYLPVNDVIYGDKFTSENVAEMARLKDKIENLSNIATGDKDKFLENIQEYTKVNLAIKKTDGEKDDYDKEWHAQFGVPKYDAAGLEREFVGAELVTGLMKIGTDVMTGTDFPVMIQPIPQMYFTVFGYALNIFEDYELTGNVINTWYKGDIDPDDPEVPDIPNIPVPIPPVPVPPVPPVPTPPIPPVPTPPTPGPDPDPDPQGQPIIGSKYWSGDDEDERPTEVKIHVYAHDGNSKWEVAGSPVTAKKSDNWAWMLYLKAGDPAIGKRITVEEEVPDGYTVRYSGYNVINTKIPSEKKTLRGAKTWDDNDDQDGKRPESITIHLLADGTEVASKQVTAADGWKWEFKDYPAEKDGKKIAYTVSEDPVDGYETEYDGMDVTNKHVPETIKIVANKVWNDENDQDGARPERVAVYLRVDGQIVASRYVQQDGETGDWTATFDEVSKYWLGKPVDYTLTEEVVPEYKTEITKSQPDDSTIKFDVTNTYTPNKTHVDVHKVWNDSNDKDGIRPDFVIVKLLRDGDDTGETLTLNESNAWSGTFEDLDLKENGQVIPYAVDEEKTDVITGTDGPGTYSITVYKDTEGDYSYGVLNHHTPEVTRIDGTKEWDDDGDRDGMRPSAIVINLLADGKKTQTRTVQAGDDGSWSWSFENLPKRDESGKAIEYTVTESPIDGYETSIDGYAIKNTHTPKRITINVRKVWDDMDDADGIRPTSVTVRLRQDGQDTGKTLTLSKQNGWKGSFEDLYEMRDGGTAIAYEVTEDTTDVITGDDTPATYAYEITGGVDDGFVVTNIHSPETINLSGSKTWNDNDDEQGRRPESITIRLHADGKEIDSRTVTEDDEWKWNFPNLPKRNHGKEIDYTITEDAIPRYVTEIDGMDVTNTPICGPDEALYMVEFYYQVEGQYPTEPDYSEQRVGKLDETVKATEDDLTPQKERHVLDDDAENILEGVVKDDDSLVLRVYFKPWFVVTYDPNGGKFADGGAKPIDEQHYYGETISIHAAPTRSEHDFLYWKGSAYRPGDSYTVIGDHTFVAQWAKKFIPRTDIPQLGGSVACVAGVLAAATGAFLGLRYLRGRHED